VRILADTSGLYATLDENEPSYLDAVAFSDRRDVEFVLPDTVLEELFTLLRRRFNARMAFEIADGLSSGDLGLVIPQTEQDRADTWRLLREYMGVPLSYVDASVIVLGRRLGIGDVFSFDSDFRLAGLSTLP
jgi:predicted nucleic acid-binding protein